MKSMKKSKSNKIVGKFGRIPCYSTYFASKQDTGDNSNDARGLLYEARRKRAFSHRYTKKDLCVMIAKIHLANCNKYITLDYENMLFEIEAALHQNGLSFCYNENPRSLSHLFTIKELEKLPHEKKH